MEFYGSVYLTNLYYSRKNSFLLLSNYNSFFYNKIYNYMKNIV